MTERLIVFLKGKRIGAIAYDYEANSREFSYDADYLASAAACPISLSLPLQPQPFDSWRTRLFFENLLPPDIVRRKLEKIRPRGIQWKGHAAPSGRFLSGDGD